MCVGKTVKLRKYIRCHRGQDVNHQSIWREVDVAFGPEFARENGIEQPLAELFQAAAAMETGRDPLTRALNRRFMPSILTREVRMASQKAMDLSVLMIDIDHFKNINDTYGHSSGDAVLQQVAEAILSLCRPSDFVFRYGGEEFLVALVEADENKAFTIAEELRRQIAQQPLNLPDGARQSVTLSIGVAAFNGHPDYSHLVNAADRALYRAKQAGRNRCEKEVPLAIH